MYDELRFQRVYIENDEKLLGTCNFRLIYESIYRDKESCTFVAYFYAYDDEQAKKVAEEIVGTSTELEKNSILEIIRVEPMHFRGKVYP